MFNFAFHSSFMVLTEKHIQILEKAELLFAEKGFDGTTVRDIADYAGVNLAMISYYFGSKEKLMEALFTNRMSVTKARIEDIIANKSLSFIQKIDILIDEYVNKVVNQQCFYRVMFQAQVINKNKEVIRLIKDFKFGYVKQIATLIEEGQKAKKIKKDIDIVLLLNTMTGTVTQLIINKDFYREFNNYKKLSDTAFDELLKNKLSVHIKHLFKAIMGYEQ
ncbi:MAG: TetR family transcriptional regulator [Ferruginibacter sp.]